MDVVVEIAVLAVVVNDVIKLCLPSNHPYPYPSSLSPSQLLLYLHLLHLLHLHPHLSIASSLQSNQDVSQR